MLKKLSAISLTALTFATLAIPAFAAADSTPLTLCAQDLSGKSQGNYQALCGLNFTNFPGLIITIVFVIAIVLALAYLIWGGIKWILSGGDKAKVDAARSSIVAAIVGLVIVFLSYFILSVVVPIFVPGFNFTNLAIPSINQ